MPSPSKLVWNEVRKGTEWRADNLAPRFYKIVHRPGKPGGERDTHRADFYSLYNCYPEGMDHYIASATNLEFIQILAQEHVDRQ